MSSRSWICVEAALAAIPAPPVSRKCEGADEAIIFCAPGDGLGANAFMSVYRCSPGAELIITNK